MNEDSSEHFLKQETHMPKKMPFKRTNIPKVVSKNGTTPTQPAVAGKIKTKPSVNTKSFLQEMRKKKMHQQTTIDDEDVLFVSGTHTIQ
jgi:hypothetical protein